MNHRKITGRLVHDELEFTAARSGGPGGQLVNKVSSKVLLRWDISNSRHLTADEKVLLLQKLKSRIVGAGELMIVSQESRSQHDNKRLVLIKLDELLQKAQEKQKARRATKATKSSKEKRLTEKKRASEKKEWRKRI
jgi:ribosome-associated protein